MDVEFAGRLDPPTTLAEIKQSNLFGDWALVRQGRLSTMAAPEEFVAWIRSATPKRRSEACAQWSEPCMRVSAERNSQT